MATNHKTVLMKKLMSLVIAMPLIVEAMSFFPLQIMGSNKPGSAEISFQTGNAPAKISSDSVFFTPQYFYQLQQYIRKNGRSETVDASSSLDEHMYIEYHILSYQKYEFTVDHTNRIYISLQGPAREHLGNILLKDDKHVVVECDDVVNSKKIFALYNEIMRTI